MSDLDELTRSAETSLVATPSAASTSSPNSLDDLVSPKMLSDLTSNQESKMRTETAIEDRTRGQLDIDRADAQRWHEASGHSLDDVRKWDADAERKKYAYDPVDAFGSFASVFAIAASAFTKTPMENSLNGAAAAMTAIRQGKDEDYQRAFTAWKENNSLAIKRGEMMHQQYTDALSLMNTDYKRGEIEMQQAARRFGDQQILTLLNNGYSAEAFDVINKRNAARLGMAKADEAITEVSTKKKAFDVEAQEIEKEPDPLKRAGYMVDLYNRVYAGHKMQSPQIEVASMMMREHGPGTKDPWPADKFLEEFRKQGLLPYANRNTAKAGSKADLIQTYEQQNRDEHPDWSEAQIKGDANRRAEADTTKRTGGAANQEMIDAKSREYQDAGMKKTEADIKATRFIRLANATPTGNRIDQLRARTDQIKYADEIIGDVEKLLKKHNAITGLGGKITRGTEVLSNVLGSNATDRKEFESKINELQLLMPRILTDSQGRPLGTEASHIGTVVRGLNLGDTVANTSRRMEELRKQLAEMNRDTAKRIQGGGTDEPEQAKTPAQSGTPRWQQAPVVQ